MFKKKEQKDGSESDSDGDDYVPPVMQEKPKAPPPKRKEPLRPDEILDQKMKMAVNKIGGIQEISPEEMAQLWTWGDDQVVPPEVMTLMNDKLRQSASLGNVNACWFLLTKRADINAQCPFTGNTPLMQAVQVTQHLDKQRTVIEYLMNNGADCNLRNKGNLTPKSAMPGLPDNPLVVLCRELDLRVNKPYGQPLKKPDFTVDHTELEQNEDEGENEVRGVKC
mmetsp:Transcript_22566/g.31783  ORF Transcript_22566/g.31783 Transcript_22566/m.31783 type:complete len:223 (+) Transcript_22566:41-709(+)|eukprot:CAMPEP_0175098620 /NCGR_PEP_ID=MMETSP0086_2-20121207/5967_1 /TAXON_ID=136419 /ORGANISM="Unknown Unknown, Strain D1" /LENGTH=222 /DNA_ID=CAMNT_0016372309 /DNA_START=33 /DNA_END=701 /DNA_ORIENTATION=+